jgi:tetratricopeptide (TPR) repeat protein
MIYLQARQKFALRGIENLIEARRLFEEAIILDPDYDPAYSGLGRALSLFPAYSPKFSALEVVGPAKDAASKALKLNPQNSEAFSVLGTVAHYLEWDWKTAEAALNKSLELNHDDAEIYNFIGDYYRVVQHPTLAIEMESRALKLDPLHAINHSDLGKAYASGRDWENALRYAKSAQGLNLDYWHNNLLLVNCYIKLGRVKEAERVVAAMNENSDNVFDNLYIKTIVNIAKEEIDVALINIDLMTNLPEGRVFSYIAKLYLDLEMFGEAAYWFEKAYENHEAELPLRFCLPENLPDHPALQAALNKPELNALFKIRRKNLGLTNNSP